MGVYLPPGRSTYVMDFQFHGVRIYESTGFTNKQGASRVMADRKRELQEGRAGFVKPKAVSLFASAANEFMDNEAAKILPGMTGGRASSLRIHRQNLVHLLKVFGKRLMCDIMPIDVAKYQQARIAAEAAPTTINNEMGTFRSVMTPSGNWARLLPKISMMDVDYEVGIALTAEQEAAVFEGCYLSESRLLYPIVLLGLETGSRPGTVRKLPWSEVDFEEQGLRWGKDKTAAGTNRTIPISQRAMAMLDVWKENFPDRLPKHFVFPSERYCQPKDAQRGVMSPYITDPTKHVISVRRSWETALQTAGWILAGRPDSMVDVKPFHCRFHDLRHTACTRMIEGGTPIPIVAQLVGWSPTTMWEMAKKYGHFSQDKLREAVETISGNSGLRTNPRTYAPRPLGGIV
jgi:integrase